MATESIEPDVQASRGETLGNVRLRHHETNEIILVPTPTDDPNDPVNWSKAYRVYIAVLVSCAIFFSNFLAAGPTVAMVEITESFFGPPGPDFSDKIAKAAYFFTTTALLQGLGNLIWMPLIVKYGRRPSYIASFILYTATAAWAGSATTYGSELAARVLMGFASGAAETLVPLTISDIFFLHERGTIMAIYTGALSSGVGCGIIIAGLITINLDWRYIYWVAVALIGACTVLIIFGFPETEFNRAANLAGADAAFSPKVLGNEPLKQGLDPESAHPEVAPPQTTSNKNRTPPQRLSYWQTLSIFTGVHTQETFFKLFIRPIVMLTLPPVLWATLVMAVTIGFLVAISSNFASAFSETYGFEAWQCGLCFIAAVIGALVGGIVGGSFSDWVADMLTRRNGGVRQPEMRLPAMIPCLITAPLALVLYGVGVGQHLHWMVPTLGLAFLNFAIVQGTNVTLVYAIDAYRPVAGEITVTQHAFKAAFGFLLSFYTNPWITQSGYEVAFGTMAAISGGVILCWIPMFVFGSRIRRVTWGWGFIRRLAHWHEDREVGE
ncbi:major facilitator superfamily domain-containing protein [Achaetomium macrosporum]|uniref:Major facilitator superfamily domain-containing protein n=1 Tax=Achaetomium macrosporum TaxID=79813 RepID=A0AAN7C475_9PEZI|nr:major facilitator superfamily domain-containing protein [Achaetomium macrosporum]